MAIYSFIAEERAEHSIWSVAEMCRVLEPVVLAIGSQPVTHQQTDPGMPTISDLLDRCLDLGTGVDPSLIPAPALVVVSVPTAELIVYLQITLVLERIVTILPDSQARLQNFADTIAARDELSRRATAPNAKPSPVGPAF